MKYISLIINILLGLFFVAIAINYCEKGYITFAVVFAALVLDRVNIANLYWKMKDEV